MSIIKFIKSLFEGKEVDSAVSTTEAKSSTVEEPVMKSELHPSSKKEEPDLFNDTVRKQPTDSQKASTPKSRKPIVLDEKKQHIYNLIIVDESGSMEPLCGVTLSGVNETISSIKKAQKEFGETQQHFLTLVTFHSERDIRNHISTHYDAVDIESVGGFTEYCPMGCTPLYDTMGESLTKLHRKIKDDENATAVVTILTDGLENASREWKPDGLRKLIGQLKEEGWVFSYMGSAHNVKEVTDLLNIDNVMEFSHDLRGASNTWARDRASKMSFFRSMVSCCDDDEGFDIFERRSRKKEMAARYFNDRVTPHIINTLGPDEVFVFGTNSNGHHTGVAARGAMQLFGAEWGQGVGEQGQSYAIPTSDGLERMQDAIHVFCIYASRNPDKHFLVTKVGCGGAGYTPREIAPLFKQAIELENVSLPKEFWEVLGLRIGSMLN